jgi:hypothetical protein
MQFEPLDLNVLVGRGGQLWVSARSRLGAVYAVPRRRRAGWPADLREAREILGDAVLFANKVPDQARAIGSMLQQLLFGDPEVLALFQRTRGAAADQGRPLLVGVLGAPHEVAALPWELTLDPEGGRHEYLTLAPDAHVVRLARARTYPIRTDPIPPPLHLLLVLSSPTPSSSGDEVLPFDLYEEKRSMLDELAPLVDDGKLTVDVEDRPSLENLRRRISGRTRGYHLVHYLGHARQAELMLENRLGSVRDVDAATFTGLLQACPDLRLVVYAGCLTASLPEEEDGDGGTAGRDDWHRSLSIADLSVRVATPTVVGMQAVLPFRTERLFARFFYRALASGRTLPDAVQLARAAIRSDEFVGELLDWVVPALFVGGENPGPLIDPAAPPSPVDRPRRVELKLGLEEEERSTFARPVALREAVNVLSGRRRDRALLVTGSSDLRTPFVGRVLDDLGEDVSLVLYLNARELTGTEDPVRVLCHWIAELLTRLDSKERRPDAGWDGAQWWTRLLEEVVACNAVVAIDGIDELTPEAATPLGNALQRLALRRTRARVVLGGTTLDDGLLGQRAVRYALPIPLRPLEWGEVWPWIRRNLPELVRHGDEELRVCYEAGLQDDLELWSRLAEEISKGAGEPVALAERLLAERATTPARSPTPPLRAALTNPDVAGQVKEFAEWMTALATDHRLGGLVLDPARAGERSSIAELLPLPSPFEERGMASDADILSWMNQVLEHDPNVLLLDFGSTGASGAWRDACRKAAARGVLVIAAGGNSGDTGPLYPAWYPEVLAVGALDPEGGPTVWSTWDPAERKPELFAPQDLTWTRHADFVPEGRKGTSYSALGAMAAALLVWSVDRSLKAQQVRRVLLGSARLRRTARGGHWVEFRALDVSAALSRVRTDLVLAALGRGPASQRELLTATGLARDVTLPILESLLKQGRLRTVVGDDTERFELVGQATSQRQEG